MPRKRIDRFLNEALEDYSRFLKDHHEWRGKESDCVNLFAHKFLFDSIGDEAAIKSATQVGIEVPLKQPKVGYTKPSSNKDLVIWANELETTWSTEWKPIRAAKAVMEWKVYRQSFPKRRFHEYDEKWIEAYTRENVNCLGYVVSVDLASDERSVHWRQAKRGVWFKDRHV